VKHGQHIQYLIACISKHAQHLYTIELWSADYTLNTRILLHMMFIHIYWCTKVTQA